MAPGYYHTPSKLASTRARCPVCHTEVYSRAGIHPQCAVKQSEPPKSKKPAEAATDPDAETVSDAPAEKRARKP
jgi:hypothetical protein